MSTRSWRGAFGRIVYSTQDYELLPSSKSIPRRRRYFRLCLHFFTLRRAVASVALIPLLLVFIVLSSGVPPSFQDIRAFERALPQHNANVTQPAMYLRFPGHLWGHGFNNVLQESCVFVFCRLSIFLTVMKPRDVIPRLRFQSLFRVRRLRLVTLPSPIHTLRFRFTTHQDTHQRLYIRSYCGRTHGLAPIRRRRILGNSLSEAEPQDHQLEGFTQLG